MSRPTRYRLINVSNYRLPKNEDGGDTKKASDDTGSDQNTDARDDTPLKNVDQNDGGYGHGSGFDDKGKG